MSRNFVSGIKRCLSGGFFAALILALTTWSSGAQISVNVNGQQTVTDAEVLLPQSETLQGRAMFPTGADQAFLSETGQPALPFQILHVMLPPNTNLRQVALQFRAVYAPVEGSWQVAPTPPAATRDDNGNEIVVWPADRTIVDGFDTAIYGNNEFWPAPQAGLLSSGQLRGWKMAEISIPLFRYNPVTGQLLELVDADLAVDAAKENGDRFANENSRRSAKKSRGKEHSKTIERARKLAVNFEQAASAYEGDSEPDAQMQAMSAESGEMSSSPTLSDTGYVIITSNAIRSASSKLNAFIAHKQARGYTVNVITETQYGSGTGDAAANNIRTWLRNNYQNSAYGSGGILYALLIGDPRTNSSSVPMKMCIGDHPTDYFYAELTSNWDADGDGIFGEEEDTTEKYFEIYVGRIPYYGSISETDSILQKIINYESATDTQWRRRALLPMVPLDDSTPAYQMGEQIKNNLLEPRAIASTRIYEDTYNLNPSPEYTLGDRYPAAEWSQGIYGMMIWQTHGWDQGAAGIVTTGDTPNLNNAYPSAVFQGSCMNGNPETPSNLGYSILKNGGIGTIAASRNGWYYVGQTSFTNTSSVGGLGYQYARQIVEQKTLGQAIWDTKESLSYWQKNYFVYNLYGDPSVVVMPDAPVFTVTPTHGLQFHATYQGASTSSSAYTLKNNGAGAINWTVEADGADWYTLSSSGGTVGAQGTATVTITLTNTVKHLPVGKFSDTIVFTDHTNGIVEERTVTLQVHPRRKIAHWHLDETSGTTVSDAAGVHNGELVNTTFDAASTGGKFGRALQFDGTDDHIAVPGFSEEMTGLTLSAWIHATDWSGNRRIMQKGGDGSEYRLLKESSRFVFEIGSKKLQLTALPATGQWVHVAAVYDGAAMRVYYDKVLQGSTALTGPVPTSSSTLFIGTKNTGAGGGDRFFGFMDDVRIYNYAKNEAGIEALYQGDDPAEPVRPYDGAFDVLLVTDLQWMPGLGTVQSDVYLGTDYNAVLSADTDSYEYKGRQAATTFQPGLLMRQKDYFWRVDQVDAAGHVTRGPVWRFTTGLGRGGITRQAWYNISGNYVTNLTGNSRYPNSPDLTEIVTKFEGPVDAADSYGSRLYGFFIPPATGSYTFWIAGDDYSELWLNLSTDPAKDTKDPAIAEKIAWVYGHTGLREWTKYDQQSSANAYPEDILLTAGKPYYIMALHKEGGGGDHVSVSFSGPGIPQQVIEGRYLMPFAADYNWGPLFTADTLYGLHAVEGYGYNDSLAGQANAFDGGPVTWSKAAGPLWLQVAADGTLSGVPGDSDTGMQSFEVRAADAAGASSDVLLWVNVLDTFTGERGLSDFAEIAARWLAGSCSDVPACDGADLTGDAGVNVADLAAMADSWLIERPHGGRVAAWTFNEDASDVIGGFDGTLLNGAAIVPMNFDGGSGGALFLDGVDDYLEITGYKGISGATSRTCAAWIKTLVASSQIMTWGSTETGGKWSVRVSEDGTLRAEVAGGYIYGTTNLLDGNWHHIAVVLLDDGSPNIDEAVLYVDGYREAVFGGKLSCPVNTIDGIDAVIGTNIAKNGFFNGLIDHVQIYNRALTSNEIRRLCGYDLMLFLKLDETQGVLCNDSSSYGRDGVLHGNVNPAWQPGYYANALQFDGADDYVEIADYKGISEGNHRTCAAWIKTVGYGGHILSWGNTDAGSKWLVRINSAGQLRAEVQGGYISGSTIVADNDWHHIAVTMKNDGSPDISEASLYIDGRLETSIEWISCAVNTASDNNVQIGAFSFNPNYFEGTIDDVRIYDRVLNAEEIFSVMNNE